MAFNSIKRTFLLEPTVKASNLQFSNKTISGCTISWTNGDGNRRYVFVSDRNISFNPNIDSFTDGVDNTYNDTLFWQRVYNDTGNTFNFKTTTNVLNNKKNYFVRVYEINIDTFGCSVSSLNLPPLSGATSLVPLTNSVLSGEFFRRAVNVESGVDLSPLNSTGVIILGDLNPITGTPQENIVYPIVTREQSDWNTLPTIGDVKIVRNNTVQEYVLNGETKKITGLTGGTKFYFASFNYNLISGVDNSSAYSLNPSFFSGITRFYFESFNNYTFIPNVDYTIRTSFKLTSLGVNFNDGIFFNMSGVTKVSEKIFTVTGDTGDFNDIELKFTVNEKITRKIRLDVGSIDGIYTDFILTSFNNPIILLLDKYGSLL